MKITVKISFITALLFLIVGCATQQLQLPTTKNVDNIILYGRTKVGGNRVPWTEANLHVRKGDQILLLLYGDVKVNRGWVKQEDILWYRIGNNIPERAISGSGNSDYISYFTAKSTGKLQFAIADGIPESKYFEDFTRWKKGKYNASRYSDNQGSFIIDTFVTYKSSEQFLPSALEDIRIYNPQDQKFAVKVDEFKDEFGWVADLYADKQSEEDAKTKEDLIWEEYLNKNEAESYVEYITLYANSPYIPEAKKNLNLVLLQKYKDGFWSDKRTKAVETATLMEEMTGYGIGLANAILADINYLGLNGDPNLAEAVYQAGQAMEKGDPFGTYLYAKFLYRGIGIKQDEARAVDMAYSVLPKILTQAYTDDPLNQYALGWMYFNGVGVPQNQKEAFSLYQKAAAEAYPAAQYNVGIAYLSGEGVDQDYALAKKWIEKYAGQGFGRAQNDLGWMYENGLGFERDINKAVNWYKQAAEKGITLAQLNLGIIYEQGRDGIKKNLNAARRWYQLAANQGNPTAVKALEVLNGK